MTKEALAQFHLSSRPEEWPEVDELPQAETLDIQATFRNTIEVNPEY